MFYFSIGLAEALRETNENLHTSEFMLGKYRQMAKISPFLVKASEAESFLISKSESNICSKSNEEVMEQLKVLSDAIDKIKPSNEEGQTKDFQISESSAQSRMLTDQKVRKHDKI